MKFFNAGAMRPATDGARLSAAKDLVQRTLAQHGLVPQNGQANGMPMPNMPSLDGLLSQFTGILGQAGAAQVPVPSGAQFKRETFKRKTFKRETFKRKPFEKEYVHESMSLRYEV